MDQDKEIKKILSQAQRQINKLTPNVKVFHVNFRNGNLSITTEKVKSILLETLAFLSLKPEIFISDSRKKEYITGKKMFTAFVRDQYPGFPLSTIASMIGADKSNLPGHDRAIHYLKKHAEHYQNEIEYQFLYDRLKTYLLKTIYENKVKN